MLWNGWESFSYFYFHSINWIRPPFSFKTFPHSACLSSWRVEPRNLARWNAYRTHSFLEIVTIRNRYKQTRVCLFVKGIQLRIQLYINNCRIDYMIYCIQHILYTRDHYSIIDRELWHTLFKSKIFKRNLLHFGTHYSFILDYQYIGPNQTTGIDERNIQNIIF